MTRIEEMLEFNKQFAAGKNDEYATSEYPDKKMVILTCMDTRLVKLLPAALNIKNGDVKMIRNAGASIGDPFGIVMRSILIAIHVFGAEDVLVIPHYGCGMQGMNAEKFIGIMEKNGITKEQIDTVTNSGVDLEKSFKGFETPEETVAKTVNLIKEHPFVPKRIRVHGFIIDHASGRLDYIVKG